MAMRSSSVRFYIVLFICSDLVTALYEMGSLLKNCHARSIDLLLIADGNFPSVEEQTEQVNFLAKIPDQFRLLGELEPIELNVAFVSMTSFGPVEHISLLDYNTTEELKEAIINTSMVNFTALTSPPTETSPMEAFSESRGGRIDATRIVFMVVSKYTLEAEKERVNGSNGYGAFIRQVCENVYNASIFLAFITDKGYSDSNYDVFKCLHSYQHSWTDVYMETFDALSVTLTWWLCGKVAWFHDQTLTTGSWYYVPFPGTYNHISWYEAASRCAADGGDLVSIETQEELDFLRSRLELLVKATDFSLEYCMGRDHLCLEIAIGLRKNTEALATTFQWNNGNPLIISHWFPSYPKSYLYQDCGGWVSTCTGASA